MTEAQQCTMDNQTPTPPSTRHPQAPDALTVWEYGWHWVLQPWVTQLLGPLTCW